MPELRWALAVLGAAFVVGLVIWEWRRSRRRQAQLATEGAAADDWSRRIEPRLDSLGDHAADSREPAVRDVPVIHPTDRSAKVNVPVAREVAVDLPAAAVPPAIDTQLPASPAPPEQEETQEYGQVQEPGLQHEPGPGPESEPEPGHETEQQAALDEQHAQPAPDAPPPPAFAPTPPPAASGRPGKARDIRWPPERADRVLTLRLVSTRGALLSGREVRLALEQAGLMPGPQRIYHLPDANGAVLVSAANMLRPGDLDPLKIDEEQLRGLSLFSVLPGPLPPVRMLEELVAVARAVSWRLGATVQDEHGAELDGEVLVRLRKSLPDEPQQENA